MFFIFFIKQIYFKSAWNKCRYYLFHSYTNTGEYINICVKKLINAATLVTFRMIIIFLLFSFSFRRGVVECVVLRSGASGVSCLVAEDTLPGSNCAARATRLAGNFGVLPERVDKTDSDGFTADYVLVIEVTVEFSVDHVVVIDKSDK